jgi:hypothetical protein
VAATAEEFLTLLPQFEDVEPATITAWLAEAARFVDTGWGEDEDRAQIFLAAHMMSVSGIGPEKGAATLAGVKSISSASLSITKDDSLGDFGLTSFGRLYLPIRNAVKGGIYVTGTGQLPWPYGGPYVG